jgi:uncharacterized membrane protein YdbT with pleckstrin-like domain
VNQLHPRAVWLFFINFFIASSVLSGFGIGFVVLSISEGVGIGFALGLFLILGLIWLLIGYLWARLSYHFYRYELREDGFRKEHGIIWKKYATIPYDRIQNVDIYRGLVARLLGLSDLQIQTAGGITAGSYGAFSEGRLPGLHREVAEQLRDELVRRVQSNRGQGL